MNDANTGVAHDASTASLAARTLAQRRWGGTRVRRLVHELVERRDQLGHEQVIELRDLVAEVGTVNDEGDRR
jgi:hypothetical protein